MDLHAFRVMFTCITVLALPLAAATAQQDQQPPSQAAAKTDSVIYPDNANIEAGRAIVVGNFRMEQMAQPQQGACFQCHGIDGKGDAAAAFPRLADQTYKYLFDSLRDYASGDRNNPIMSPIARALDEQQMRDVAVYYSAQKGLTLDPQPEADVQQLQLGASIAAVGSATRGVQACINCHGPEGIGLNPYPYLAGQHANYLEAQLQAWKSGQRKSRSNGGIVMEQIAKRLTDQEIKALAIYFASVRPDEVTPEATDSRQASATGTGVESNPAESDR